MIKYRLPLIILTIVTIILISYTALIYLPNLAYATSDEKAYSVDQTLVSANTRFAFNLFRELMIEDLGKNIFISPLSVSTALTMTYNGAEDLTKEAMIETLQFGAMNLEHVNQEYSNLIESLEHADNHVKLLTGNSIWIKQEFEPLINSTFIDRIQTSYQGETYTRDFSNPQTIDDINGWVDENTHGKISELIQQIEPELVMFLINAIYFKGDWMTPFDETQTQRQDFFLSEGNTVEVDMMSTSGTFHYYSGETCQAVRLPYGRDKIAMYIFLPQEGVSLDLFMADLNYNAHEEYLERLEPIEDLDVQLPKFIVEYGVKRLNSVLEKLGLGIAFDPLAANFNSIASMFPDTLYLSYVDHKAIIEVNEKGTEAAAATNVGIEVGSLPPSLTINRPFFFEIRDDRSGSILFMGTLCHPTQN